MIGRIGKDAPPVVFLMQLAKVPSTVDGLSVDQSKVWDGSIKQICCSLEYLVVDFISPPSITP
jgi:hypothetical protein